MSGMQTIVVGLLVAAAISFGAKALVGRDYYPLERVFYAAVAVALALMVALNFTVNW